MGALDNYFGPQPFMGGGMYGGHPVIAGDDELAAAMPIALAVARRRRAAQAQRCAPQMGWDGQDIMGWGGGTDMGAVEAEEMAAAMEDDDDDDDDDVLGASTERLEDKLDKWKDKRKKRVSKMQSARTNAGRKLWARKVEKADDKIADLKKEIAQRKAQDRAAAGGGRDGGGGGGGGRGQPGSPAWGGQGGPLQNPLVGDAAGRYVGIQRAGVLTPITLFAGGEVEADGTFAAATVAKSTVPFEFTMDQITYADFLLKGFRLGASLNAHLSGVTPVDYSAQNLPLACSIRIVITSLMVDGFSNLLYSSITQELGGPFGLSSDRRIVDGIRSNSRIQRNNVVKLAGYLMNSFEIPASTAVTVSITAEALVDTNTDDLYGNYPVGQR